MKENYRKYMKNDDEENPATIDNESIITITDILEPEIKCNLLFLEEKGISIEEIENIRKNVINFVHDEVNKINCDKKYKSRIVIMIYQKLLHTTYSLLIKDIEKLF